MTVLQRLNTTYKVILFDPFDQNGWNQLDQILLDLKYNGYIFYLQSKDFSGSYIVVNFNTKEQLTFVRNEIKKALYLELHQYLQELLNYKKNTLQKWWKEKKKKVRIYSSDSFMEKDGVIHFNLGGHPLLDIKIMTIIKRRCKLACENNKKN